MKKIAFFVQLMLCGRGENALIALTNKLSNDVTIYVVKKSGDFINKVPQKVKLVSIPMEEKIRKDIPIGGTKSCVYECIKKKQYIQASKYLFSRILKPSDFAELNVNFSKISVLVLKLLTVGRLEEQKDFDLAIKFCKFLKEKNYNLLLDIYTSCFI